MDKSYLEACLHAIGGRIGRDRPYVFIIDDAHYMDELSWRCVVALGRGPTTLSVIAYRTLRKEMPAFRGYVSVQSDPEMGAWVSRFVLPGLSRDDMIKLGGLRAPRAALMK